MSGGVGELSSERWSGDIEGLLEDILDDEVGVLIRCLGLRSCRGS
jgi:hypothetical protein